MSIEGLLLAFFFLVLPLIEMYRAARQRAQEQARRQAAQRQQVLVGLPSGPAMQTQLPPEEWDGVAEVAPERAVAWETPVVAMPIAVQPAVRQTMSDKIAARRRSAQSEVTAESLVDRTGVIRGLRSPGGLQRAMIVMTILGPCRAVDPHSWREIDEPN